MLAVCDKLGPAAPIKLRGSSNMCVDSTGADFRTALHLKPCSGSNSQHFNIDGFGDIRLNDTSAACDQGPPCCAEHYWGLNDVVSLRGCTGNWSDFKVADYEWKYVNTSGALQTVKALDGSYSFKKVQGCMTATKTGEVHLMACNASDPNQAWDVTVP